MGGFETIASRTGSLEAARTGRQQLLASLLASQHQMTAVEEFAAWHDRHDSGDSHDHYRELIPLSAPKAGEQYAFEVDLDTCSGCQACVAACHNMNGLEPDEQWRGVGLLLGGTTHLPVIQHVTSSCHHCLEPACLEGCPVNAYQKDESTGIVKHLDDQCIGCQYCILKCPYDVPRYSHDKGIVRKCDMCHGRLSAGEAPACVQSCPNHAIRIRIVNKQQIADDCEANQFVPGAPEPSYTLPTTIYKSARPMPRNLLPADYYSVSPQQAHLPLVWMLVLTQMSVGTFIVDQVLMGFPPVGMESSLAAARPVHAVASLLIGLLGLAASTLHLGRPHLAYRAVIGVRKSWLSREILAFSGFALFATLFAAIPLVELLGTTVPVAVQRVIELLVMGSGVTGVFCSIMIYVSTRRPFWNLFNTGSRFFLTGLVLGLPAALVIWLISAFALEQRTVTEVMVTHGSKLCVGLVIATTIKFLAESAIFFWLTSRQFTPLKRTAVLMIGELASTTRKRFVCGFLGGVLIPGMLAGIDWRSGTSEPSAVLVAGAVLASLVLLIIGELFERYLYFTAVVAPKMPGVSINA